MAIYDLMDLLEAKKEMQHRLTCKLCRKAHEAEKFYVICPDCVEEHKDCGKAFETLLKANEMLAAEITSSAKRP